MSLRPDAWLSAILGKPAFHLSGAAFDRPKGEAFIDAKVAVDDTATLLALQAQGFIVMDTNVQFTRSPGPVAGNFAGVRAAKPDDAAAVMTLAAKSFTYDRFHCDPAIGHAAASRLKAEWAGNYFAGHRGERMIVAEDAHGLCGFLQLLKAPSGFMTIDLIAVDARSRGAGIARSMIALAAKDADAIQVGTQIANLPSLALYQELGFRFAAAFYVLHLNLPGIP